MARYGQTSQALTNSALCDFTHNYRRRQSTEWAPVGAVQPDPPLLISPPEIYHKHVGLLPHYVGHLPGAKFRCVRVAGYGSNTARFLNIFFKLKKAWEVFFPLLLFLVIMCGIDGVNYGKTQETFTRTALVYRYGQTYGNDSRDGKRWLRGDFAT